VTVRARQVAPSKLAPNAIASDATNAPAAELTRNGARVDHCGERDLAERQRINRQRFMLHHAAQ
jgi:hypothetical protein